MIVFDTARADAFEPYGAPAGASPAVAQLARSGAASPATFSTACWTVPAHISLFTARLPRSVGFRPMGSVGGYRPLVRGLAARTLPAALSRAGYQTAALSTNGLVSGNTGFDAGFDEFEIVRGWRTRKLGPRNLRTRLAWYQEALRARLDDGAAQVEHRLERWMAERRRRPFFWFVNLVECHSPYLPPRPYNDLSALDRLRAGHEARRYLSFTSIWKCSTGGFDVPEAAIGRMRHLYAASIRQLDDWLARVLDALGRHGVLEETQVVVTSDHGENLGDGEMLGHAFSLDDRLLRVPFVTAGPAALPDRGIGSLADVAGWLADVGAAEHGFGCSPRGVAVAQFDAAPEPGDARVDRTIRDWRIPPDRADEVARRLTTSFTAATDGGLKLVRRLGREELFDLADDPVEERPEVVGPEHERLHAERLASLRHALDAAEAEERGAAGVDADEADGVSAEEAARLEEQMRLLGYM